MEQILEYVEQTIEHQRDIIRQDIGQLQQPCFTLKYINRLGEQLEGGYAGWLCIVQRIRVPGHGLSRMQEYGF